MTKAKSSVGPKRFSRDALAEILRKKRITPHRLYVLMAAAAGDGPGALKPTRQYIYGIMDGSTKQPGVDYAFLIADALGCRVDDLGRVSV